MRVYALHKGAAAVHLGADAERAARNAWKALVAGLGEDSAGRPVVRGAVEGMSVQKDFAGYVAKRRLDDSPHGLCALLLAAAAMERPVQAEPRRRE